MDIKQIKKMRKQKGFSLVELLIAIAIIAILTTISIPMYTSYTVRAKTAEAYSFIGSDKTYVADQINAKGISSGPISGLATTGGSKTGKYGSVASTAAGVVTYTFGAGAGTALQNNQITFIPTVTGTGGVRWTCISSGTFDSNPCDGI